MENVDMSEMKNELSSVTGSEYSPEMVIIRKDWLYFATAAMRLGRESMQAELFDHDRRLGRTIQRNKWAAETMERDIKKMDLAIKRLNDFKFSHFQNAKDEHA
jgi:hypothetical protein